LLEHIHGTSTRVNAFPHCYTRRIKRAIVETRTRLWVLGLGLFSLTGCAGEEAALNLEVRGLPPAVRTVAPQDSRLKVAVAPFEDARAEPGPIGTHKHLGSRDTPFNVMGAELGEGVVLMLIDELKYRQGWDAWLSKPGVTPPEGGPDVTISGQVVRFIANARTWFGLTEITVNMELAVQALNGQDGTEVRLTLVGDGSRRVFLFEQTDIEELLNVTLRETLKKLLEVTKVEHRALQLKQPSGAIPDQPARNHGHHHTVLG